MAKQESIPFLTPFLAARYPKISKADTKGQFADGKFKTDALFQNEEDEKTTREALEAAATKFWPDQEDVTLPLKTFYNNKEDKAAKKNGAEGITLKSKYRPAVFDAKKKAIPESVSIGGGSIIRVASFLFPWKKTVKVKVKDPKTGRMVLEDTTEFGVSMRLGDVQVRKLVLSQSGGDGAAFDEDEEGYSYDGEGDEGSAADQFGDATDL